MIIEHSGPLNKIKLTPKPIFREVEVKTLKKKMPSNPQYFQTKSNAIEMLPEVSRFRRSKLPSDNDRDFFNFN